MIFQPTPLPGVYVVRPEPHRDNRGSFERLWCEVEAAAAGISARIVQCNLSTNSRRGTVRGMHLQLPPSREGKLVRCIRGAICDVVVDLRPESETFGLHFKANLTEQDGLAIWVPPMVAHGFMSLEDDTRVLYEMSDFFAPELSAGVRWNDPYFGIEWPAVEALTISGRDAAYEAFDPVEWRDRMEEARRCG